MALTPTSCTAEVGVPVPAVQATAMHAAWLAYAPPPATSGVVCMVDSGVDPNPDTTAAVIGGQALSPNTDTLDEVAALSPPVEPGNHPDGHGTVMAMIMAAPVNGWGMVGIAPTSVRVYNMKALPAGQLEFPLKEFYLGIEACQRLHESAYPTMTVVNLSLGAAATPEGSILTSFKRAVASARAAGMNIAAAAGDTPGPVQFPANDAPVLAVGAADASQPPGVPCSFSPSGEGLDLLAPGCDAATGGLEIAFQDTGEPALSSGSSQASAEVAAVEASIDSYNPTLTPEQTEACLTSTAETGEVNAEAAFDACGLEHIVQAAKNAEPIPVGQQTTSSPDTSPSSNSPTVNPIEPCGRSCPPQTHAGRRPGLKTEDFEVACSAPRPTARRMGRRAHLHVREIPADCRLQARVGTIVHGTMRWKRTYTGLRTSLTVPATPSEEIQARFQGLHDDKLPSPWVRVAIS
ncbi:MAG: S8 family serine peptidase [Solirubrobacteraceae bacterium]